MFRFSSTNKKNHSPMKHYRHSSITCKEILNNLNTKGASRSCSFLLTKNHAMIIPSSVSFQINVGCTSQSHRHTQKKKIRLLPTGDEPITFRAPVRMLYHLGSITSRCSGNEPRLTPEEGEESWARVTTALQKTRGS